MKTLNRILAHDSIRACKIILLIYCMAGMANILCAATGAGIIA